jgi:hypothetical protein
MSLNDWLTLKEAADLIPNVKTGEPSVSRTRVWQFIREGRLPATMKAGRLFVKRKDLDAFLETERREGRPRNE